MKLRFEVQICVAVSYFFLISAKSVKLNAAEQDKNDKTSKKVDAEDMTGASVNLYRVLMHKHVNEEKIEEDKGVKPKHKHNYVLTPRYHCRGLKTMFSSILYNCYSFETTAI